MRRLSTLAGTLTGLLLMPALAQALDTAGPVNNFPNQSPASPGYSAVANNGNRPSSGMNCSQPCPRGRIGLVSGRVRAGRLRRTANQQ